MNRKAIIFPALSRQKARVSRTRRFAPSGRDGLISELVEAPHLGHWLFAAAERVHFNLRDQVILRIACETGACISEILRVTVGDWRTRGCRQEIVVSRSSHRGQHMRLLYLRPETVRLLLRYVSEERKQCDLQHRELRLLADTDPLFLSRQQRAYSYVAFASRWKALCIAEGISLPLRELRAWYVIHALKRIHEHPSYPVDAERLKRKLVQAIGWQSCAPLQKYEHYLRAKSMAEDLDRLLQVMHKNTISSSRVHKQEDECYNVDSPTKNAEARKSEIEDE
jgi:integrase